MNNIAITGNVTADAETRHLPDGKPVVSFSVADNRGKDKPAIFWRCSWFGDRAAKVAPYLLKGGAVTAIGSVQEEEWTDRDGQQRKGFKVIVSDVALQGGRQQSQEPAPRPTPQRTAPAPQKGGFAEDFSDMSDDIPFISASMHCDMQTSKQKRMTKTEF